MARWLSISLALAVLAQPVVAASESRQQFASRICAQVETEAKANELEPAFFARLLWRESLFDPNVTSPKGAGGIAQFMPETAARRGLADPYEPTAAVKASAAYLAELKKRFGNNGLAAAAYNAGEDRVARWLDGKSKSLPAETTAYVSFITGHEAEEWRKAEANFASPSLAGSGSFSESCTALASSKDKLASAGAVRPRLPSAPPAPWGAVLAVNFDEGIAVAQFRRLKLRFPAALANRDPLIKRQRNLSRGTKTMVFAMLGAKSRDEASETCATLSAAGAPCIVRKN